LSQLHLFGDDLQRDDVVGKFLSEVSFASATRSRENDASMLQQQRDVSLDDGLGN